MGNLLSLLGTIFGPIGVIFNAIFYGPIYNILMLIYNLIHATGIAGGFGLSIIALTLLVRCCMIPLTRKQLKSSRAMQELAPQINALKVQYRGDPQGLMKAQQDLYKEHGYSPISGCLPLLIQMPFLYALLFSFRTLLTENLHTINKSIYPFLPHLTTLPDPYFLWVKLSTPDPTHILPLLAAFFTLIQLRMAMPVRKKPAPGTPSDPTTQATQTTMYIMPVITFIFALNFPAGLALYWTVGAMFASTQQYFLAGWGSLFLGIPGFEHLVPPPKELPGTTPAGSAASTGRAGMRSLVASPSSAASSAPEPSGGLFGGLFRQIRAMGAAAQAQSQQAAKSKKDGTSGGNVVDALPASREQLTGVNGTKKADTGTNSGPVYRRARSAAKTAAVLVPKPAIAAKSAELPEKAIQREATTPPSGRSANSAAPAARAARTSSNNNNNNNNNSLPKVNVSSVPKTNGNGNGNGASPNKAAATTGRPAAVSAKAGSNSVASTTTTNAASRNGSPKSTYRAGGNARGSSSSSNRNRSTNRSKGGK